MPLLIRCTGRSWDMQVYKANRPEAITHLRDAFAFLENGFLADGRDWILKTEKPALADIEGQHLLHDLTACSQRTNHLHSRLALSLDPPTPKSLSTNPRLQRTLPQSLCLDRALRQSY